MNRYEYATMPVAEVLGMIGAVPPGPDAYLSDDQSSRAFADLLQRGFRWVRSEDGQAIFERTKGEREE